MSDHSAVTFTSEDVNIPAGSILRKLPIIFGVIGIAGLAVSFLLKAGSGADYTHVSASVNADNTVFAQSYLTSYMFWLSMGLGGLIFTLIHHATRAGWSVVVRRLAENFMMTLPLMALLAAPVVIFAHDIFEWTHADVVAKDKMLQAKTFYLNEGFFHIRVGLYLVIWSALAFFFYRHSTKQDETGDQSHSHKTRFWSPLGIVFFAFTITTAAMDYMMSLDPHWFSTIFGVYYFAGTFMSIFCMMTLIAMLLQRQGLLKNIITTEHYQDLGKYMFAFMVFWTYIAFSQYMLIWYANIPEETYWYTYRWMEADHGTWRSLCYALIFGHFAIPFLALMSRHVKRRRVTLAIGAVWLLVFHYLDMYFLVQPALDFTVLAHGDPKYIHGLHFSLLDLTTFIGIGGLVMAVFFWRLGAKPLIPIKDPRLKESLAFENF